MIDDTGQTSSVELATELTIAWLSNPNTRAATDEVPAFLAKMHDAVQALGQPASPSAAEPSAAAITPATTVRKSLSSRDHIISLIDGKPYKALRRHLSTHGLTPEQYRERYSLKADYPMVAPSYSEARRSMAQKIGLGQKGRAARIAAPAQASAPATAPAPAPVKAAAPVAKTPQKRGRKPKVAKAE